jgi:peptidyl-prolyl cis-trans isomerase D
MLASFRRLSKSTVGTAIMALFLIAIVASFALADVQGILSGGSSGAGGDSLVKVGSERVTDRDMTRAMDRRLSQAREQNPEATYASIAGDFDQLLSALVDAETLEAFANKFGFTLSKRLVDAQIANIPSAKGLNGQFSEQSYAAFLNQQRITDQEVRMIIGNGLLQQLMIAPAVVNARASVGMATPYASLLLEAREGEVAFIPLAAFRAGLNPTPAAIQAFYAANQRRYMVPEQRVLRIAKIGAEQVAGVQASDKEIADYYNANRAQYAPKDTRTISQAVAADQATANAIVQRLRSGQPFAAAAAPAGFSAQDIALGAQTRDQFTTIAGARVAAAAFAANEGAVVGPIQSENGWHVVKIDRIQREGGKTVAEARAEISAKLATDKRKAALENIVNTVQDAIDGGASFTEAAAAAKLPIVETPPVTADGRSPGNPSYTLPPELAPTLKAGFELAENDEPLIETLPNEAGYALVAPARIIAAAPAPLAAIRDQVTQDWMADQASQRARQLAQTIAGKAARVPLAEAVRGTPVPVRVEPVNARRIQLSQFQGKVPPPLTMLFSLGQSKVRTVAGDQGEGIYVVKVNKIIPGNALTRPTLITQTQQQMQNSLSQEYGAQFMKAMRQTVGVKRNEKAIADTRARITGSGS